MRVPSGCSKIDKEDIIDKVKGLIFGAVIGDSLGIATEGMTKSQVRDVYGEGPIRFGIDDQGIPFLRDNYRSAFDDNDFGGDSEQQLLIVQSIIQNGTFNYKEYGKLLQEYSEHGLQGSYKKPLGVNKSKDVVTHPDFPTNAFNGAEDVRQSTNKLHMTSEALVRAALLGVPKFWDGTTVIENTTDCCRITHPDPRYMMSCVIVSTLVARILRGQDLEQEDNEDTNSATITPSLPPTPTSVHQRISKGTSPSLQPLQFYNITPTPSSLTHAPYRLETDITLMKIVRSVIDTNKRILTAPNTDPLFRTPEKTSIELTQRYYQKLVETCSHFEGGPIDFGFLHLDSGVKDDHHDNDSKLQGSFECLSAGIYSFTRYFPVGQETDAFKHILMDLVMQGGEADTNATVAAALMGVKIGYSQLPSEWVVGLKRWEWLEDLVDEFCSLL